MRKILFVSSEVHPLMKTGGLADVSASLPIALHEHAQDIRILMPAYRQILHKYENLDVKATIKLDGFHKTVDILETKLPGSKVKLWLLHSLDHFDREGSAYIDPYGKDWDDNAARFALFSRAAVAIALGQAHIDWKPDVVHCNDWQTGLVPALLSLHQQRPSTVFTIHNMAYQGNYPREVFSALDLPTSLWSIYGVEYYGQLSFMKAGLYFSDHINAVSPTYAKEICRPEYAYGMEGLLQDCAKQGRLSGILNGIDYDIWNPEKDELIKKTFSIKKIKRKQANKEEIQKHFYLKESSNTLLVSLISRLVDQKGIDLAITAVAQLLEEDADIQFVCLGSGAPEYEYQLRVLRARFPDKVGLTIGYDEALSHQIEAGSDVFLMPSRFEPCGLNQMYSLRYGTLPIVRETGGLADTVVDASDENRKAGVANGFSFDDASSEAVYDTLTRAITLFQRPRLWRKMMIVAMERDSSWERSAQLYIQLYDQIMR